MLAANIYCLDTGVALVSLKVGEEETWQLLDDFTMFVTLNVLYGQSSRQMCFSVDFTDCRGKQYKTFQKSARCHQEETKLCS